MMFDLVGLLSAAMVSDVGLHWNTFGINVYWNCTKKVYCSRLGSIGGRLHHSTVLTVYIVTIVSLSIVANNVYR